MIEQLAALLFMGNRLYCVHSVDGRKKLPGWIVPEGSNAEISLRELLRADLGCGIEIGNLFGKYTDGEETVSVYSARIRGPRGTRLKWQRSGAAWYSCPELESFQASGELDPFLSCVLPDMKRKKYFDMVY